MNFKQTFESKGVLDAKQRLLRVSGDVREPFPAAVRLNLHLHSFMKPAKFGNSSIYAFVRNEMPPAQHSPISLWHGNGVFLGIVACHLAQLVLPDNQIIPYCCMRRWQMRRWTRW